MNFKNHILAIRKRLEECLANGNKSDIVEGLSDCLLYAKSLLKVDDFDFWLSQIDAIDIAEIPMTKFGLEEALRSLQSGDISDRISLRLKILDACDYLLTYSKDGDDCLAQSQYRYYYHMADQVVFKISDLGFTEPPCILTSDKKGDVRIAKLSELCIDPSELI